MSHQCPRNGCTRTVGDQMLFCGPDWKRVPPHLQRAVYAAYRRGAGIGSDELFAAQDAAIRAVNGAPEPEPVRPSPAELWHQAGGNRELYARLLREHGHVIESGDEGAAPLPPCVGGLW